MPFPLSEEGAKAANGMSADDKGYLFEAAGYLIAQCCPDVETQTSYLRLLLPPLVEQLETGLNEAERRMQVGDDDNVRITCDCELYFNSYCLVGACPQLMEVLGVWVVDLLSSIGHITKGFKNVQHAELVTLLMSISGSAMRAVHMAPESTEIRDKVRLNSPRSRLTDVTHRIGASYFYVWLVTGVLLSAQDDRSCWGVNCFGDAIPALSVDKHEYNEACSPEPSFIQSSCRKVWSE